MSRTTIQISIPASAPPAAPAPKVVGIKSRVAHTAAVADSWVAQAPDAAKKPAKVEILAPQTARDEGFAFTVRLSAQPDPFEAAKIFFFLPQAALWFWSFGWAQRTLRGPEIWRP
jgi:hypothetical protein